MPTLAISSTDYFPSHIPKPDSNFRIGFLVEAVHPLYPDHVAPGRVISVNPQDHTFTVAIDDWTRYSTESCLNSRCLHESPYSISFVSHAGDGRILPPGLAALRGIPFLSPPGWEMAASLFGVTVRREDKHFSWLQYLTVCTCHHENIRKSIPPDGAPPENAPYIPSTKYFEWNTYRLSVTKAVPSSNACNYSIGTLVEAVLPSTPNRKNVLYQPAVVTRCLGTLVWVSFEGNHKSVMFDVSSVYIRLRACNPVPTLSSPSATAQLNHPSSPITRSRSIIQKSMDSPPATKLIKIRIHTNRCFRGPKISDIQLRLLPRLLGPGKPEDVLHKLVYLMSRCFSMKRGLFVPLSQWSPDCYPDGANHSVRRPIYWYSRGPPCCVRVHSIAFPTTVLGATEFCKRLCLLLSLCPGYITASPANDDEEVVLQERSFTEICTFLCAPRQLPSVYSDERRFSVRVKGSLAFPLQIRGHAYDHPLDMDTASSTSSSEEASLDRKLSSTSLNRIVTRGKKFVVPPSLIHTHRPASTRKRLSAPPTTTEQAQCTHIVSSPAAKRTRLERKHSIDSQSTFTHPRTWTTDDLIKFLVQHSTPSPVCDWARREKLDGSAFMLLDCPMMYCLGLNSHIVKHLGDLIIKLRKAVIIM